MNKIVTICILWGLWPFLPVDAMRHHLECLDVSIAQNDGVDYSLDGISQTLKQFQVVSLGSFHNGLAKIEIKHGDGSSYGMIDRYGKLVIPCEYSYLDEKAISDGLILLYDKNSFGYGYADYNGNIAIPFQYNNAQPFSEGLAAVQTNEDEKTKSWRFIDKQGNTVIPPIKGLNGKRIENFHDGIAVLSSYDKINRNETIYLIDRQGNVVIPEKPYRCYGRAENLFIVRNEKRGQDKRMYGLMDKKGNMVVPAIYEGIKYASEGLIVVLNKDKKVGYLDLKGAVKIPFQFENAGSFENGVTIVQKDGEKIGINKEGKTVFICPYNEVYSFSGGLALVSNNNKDGYINVKGELVIPCQFDNAHSFSEGLAVVRINGKYGYIDKNGNNTFDIDIAYNHNKQQSQRGESLDTSGNGNDSGEIAMASDDNKFSFYLEELIDVYKKKNIEFARDFFTSKGFKNKTNNEDNTITITYDGKVIKIVVRMKEEVNPFPVEWNLFLYDEQFNSQFIRNKQFSRTDYRKIGFPIISEAIDFSVYPFLGYFYIGEPVKK